MHPLHHAIEHLDEQAVAALLAGGADPNEPDPDAYGMRPLLRAVHVECEDSCRQYDRGDYDAAPRATLTRMLLDAGADPDLPDDRGQTACDVARERMHEEALELFSPVRTAGGARRLNRQHCRAVLPPLP
jgi:uncharacterized protein